MNFRGIKLQLVVLVAVVTLAVFLGGQMAIAAITIDKPLTKLLADRPELSGYEIDKQANPIKVVIGIKPDADMKAVYDHLDKDLTALLGARGYTIEVTDNRNQMLKDALYEMHFSIREGLTRGNFTEMSTEIEKIVDELGIESHALWVDQHRLYLQLRHGDSALFEIYERSSDGSKLAG